MIMTDIEETQQMMAATICHMILKSAGWRCRYCHEIHDGLYCPANEMSFDIQDKTLTEIVFRG